MAERVKVLVPEEDVAKRIKELGEQISKDYAGKQVHLICVLRTTTKTEAVTLKQMKSLSLTVQRAIQEIFRKYSDWITRLQCATLYTQYM